jgi:hypothetical protein
VTADRNFTSTRRFDFRESVEKVGRDKRSAPGAIGAGSSPTRAGAVFLRRSYTSEPSAFRFLSDTASIFEAASDG